jgi:sirohydrochlorin ferrochelatase
MTARGGLVVLAVLACAATGAFAREKSEIGVILMANGGTKSWTKSVSRAMRDAELPYNNRVFFGAGDSVLQQNTLQDIVRDLEDDGANTIVIIPLVASPFSETFRQWRYLLGNDVQPGYNNTPLFPINKHSTIRFSEPLNDSAVVIEILLDRIQEISRKSEQENVIIVTPGPRDNDDNARLEQILRNISLRIRERGKFKSVEGASLREDVPSSERQKSMAVFRAKVERAQQNGQALVVPLILTSGGIEHKISLELRGLAYTYNNKALLPDSRISEWIRSQLP